MNILNKFGKKKIYFGLAGLLIILHLIILFSVINKNKSFTLEGVKYKYISEKDGVIYFKDSEENPLKVLIKDSDSLPPAPNSFANIYEVEYKEGTIRVDYSDWLERNITIRTADLKEYSYEYLTYRYSWIEDVPREVALIAGIEMVYDFVKSRPLAMAPFFPILFIFIGLGSIIYTEKLWRFQHRWTVIGGEPTEFTLVFSKLMGLVLVLFAILLPIFY